MAGGMQAFFGIGNLTRDPELRYLQSGHAVCKFGLAIGERIKRGGEWKDEPTFLNVTCWGKRGETVAQYLRKGSQCAVRGRIRVSKYESKRDGTMKTSWEINADEVLFLARARGGERREAPGTEADPPYADDVGERDVRTEGPQEEAQKVEEPLPDFDEGQE